VDFEAERLGGLEIDHGALNVRFVPLATIRPQQFAALFDDLVGAGKQRGRK
jgi:hypothetical protein